MPATSPSTSALIPRRSSVGLSRALISAEDSRRGASMWARPAMATCWKSMGVLLCNKRSRIGYPFWPLGAWRRMNGSRPPSGARLRPRVSATAAPGREALAAADRIGHRVDGVGLQARRLVAGQGLQLVAHLELVALDEGDRVLDRHFHLAALLAAGGRA